MWECFKHNIHLLFLSAHTSHVLQPLDLSIFSPLRRAYRYYLGFLAFINNFTPNVVYHRAGHITERATFPH